MRRLFSLISIISLLCLLLPTSSALALYDSSILKTTDADFSGGTFSQTAVDTGNGRVRLATTEVISNHSFETGSFSNWTVSGATVASCCMEGEGADGGYFAWMNDGGNYIRSSNFILPPGTDHLRFRRSNGADPPSSGVWVKRASDNLVLCFIGDGTNTNDMRYNDCTGLSSYIGTEVYVYAYNAQGGSWGAIGTDDFHIQDSSNINIIKYFSSGTYTSAVLPAGGMVSGWGNLSWTSSGTGTITMKARSCSTSAESSCVNYASGWGACGNITSGNALESGSPNCVNDYSRFIQYQVTLGGNTSTTPYLESVGLTFDIVPDLIFSGGFRFLGNVKLW